MTDDRAVAAEHQTAPSSDAPAVLAALAMQVADSPERDALVMADGRRITFAQLGERVARAAAGFAASGIGRGARTVVLTPPAPDFVVAMFGLLTCGAVPVLVDPGIGVRRVRTALDEVRPVAFVGAPRAHAARRVLRWAPSANRFVVTDTDTANSLVVGAQTVTLRDLEDRAALAEQTAIMADPTAGTAAPQPAGSDDEAALLFTSGSTGAPKGVVYRHDHFAAQLALLRDAYDLRPGEVTVATFPPFALFGPALGQTTVLPNMDFTRPAAADPEHLRAVIARHDADLLFASPALLAGLARHGAPLGTLRLVLSAGAPVPAHVAAATSRLLPPGGVVSTPYGMTEALPISAIAGDELLSAADAHHPPRGVCVGAPLPGTKTAIIAVVDGPLPSVDRQQVLADGTVGELLVAGPQVTQRYAARPDATARAKTEWDGTPAHRTGDLAWRDTDGRLWFCGRVVHRVHTADGPLDPLPVEQLVLDHPGVRRAALVGVPAQAGVAEHDVPVLVVQPLDRSGSLLRPWLRARRRTLVSELRARLDSHPHGAAVTDIMIRDRIPVDARHNAKIGYEQLARWAAARRRLRPMLVGRRAFGGGAS